MEKNVKKYLAPVTKPQLERMCQIIRLILNAKYPSRNILASELGVKIRTIQRDVDFLRDRWQMPLEFDHRKRGYYFTEPVANFPLLHITKGELIAFFIAHKALAQYRGTPFEAPLRTAFDKLVSSLKGEISVAWSDLEAAISFRSPDSLPPDVKTFQNTSMAVQQRREIRFQYRKLNATRFETRNLRPYHLACVSNQWYLIGFDLLRNAERTFVLSRMRNVQVLGSGFKKPSGFSIDDFLRGSFGIFSGQTTTDMVIRFDRWAAQLIRERQWHPSQELLELPKGTLELRLRLSSIVEIVPWVLSWGVHACAISPPSLVDAVRQTVDKLAEIYNPCKKVRNTTNCSASS